MDHESRGFIHDNERLVLVDDLDRNVFGCKRDGGRRSEVYFKVVAVAESVRGFGNLAVNENVFALDQFLQACATPTFDLRSKVSVQTNTGVFRSNLDVHRLPIAALEIFHERHERFDTRTREGVVDRRADATD